MPYIQVGVRFSLFNAPILMRQILTNAFRLRVALDAMGLSSFLFHFYFGNDFFQAARYHLRTEQRKNVSGALRRRHFLMLAVGREKNKRQSAVLPVKKNSFYW